MNTCQNLNGRMHFFPRKGLKAVEKTKEEVAKMF